MKHIAKRLKGMLTRLRNFGVAHRGLFPESSVVLPAFDVLNAEVPKLEALEVAEGLASKGARATRKDDARRALVDTLTRAQLTARVLVKTIPALEAHLELPAGVDDRRLITVARQFAEVAEPYAGEFAGYGVAIDAIGGQCETLETAINNRGLRRGEQIRVRAQIDASLARAMEAIATLDVAVPNHLASDAVTLAAWKRERRVHKPKRSRASAGETTDTAVTEEAAVTDEPAAEDAA